MHDKKEEKQIEETLNQLDERLSVKICEMKDLVGKREKLILILRRELLKNEINLLEKRGLVAKNLYQLLSQRNISIISNKEETVDLKTETNEFMNSCTELVDKRRKLNIKIRFLEEGNYQLIKCIDALIKKLSMEKEIIVKNELCNLKSDSPILAANHVQVDSNQQFQM